MTRWIPMLALTGIPLLSMGAQEDGKKAAEDDERCAVFLSEPEEQDEAAVQVVEEIEKEIQRRKAWFRLVDDPADSQVELALTRFGSAEELKANVERTEGTAGTSSSTLQRPALLDLESGFLIELQLTVGERLRTTLSATGRSRGLAARSLAQQVRAICDTYSK